MPVENQPHPSDHPQIRLGELLRDHRLSSKTDVSSLARKLILSAAQITAIEAGSQAAFHNTRFYLRALKKYLAETDFNPQLDAEAQLLFTQIESQLLETDPYKAKNEVHSLVSAGLAHSRQPRFAKLNRKYVRLCIIMLLLCAAVAILLALINRTADKTPAQTENTVALTQSAPTAAPATQNKPVSNSPETRIKAPDKVNQTLTQEPSPSPSLLKLTFSAPSWVQVVELNGKRIEKVFTTQDTLELDPASLASLVIGNARETQLYLNTKAVDFSKNINSASGVARFSQQEISALSAL